MERASIMRDVSQIEAHVKRFTPAPRPGQLEALCHLRDARHARSLNVKLPTGYGKTYMAMTTYSVLRHLGEVNRLLVVFPSDGQLLQFEESVPLRCRDYAIDGPSRVCDIRFFGAQAIAKHQKNECQIYAITVQSLIGARGMDNVSMLMQKGRWMVVVDEYHHYGIDKPFGEAVRSLNHEFLLCMSATPHRPQKDSAFGAPDVEVTYRRAVTERAVKPLKGHAYHYRIDAVNGENDIVSFTTAELIKEAGGDSPDKIRKHLIDRKLRWSPKYISPLVTNPIERMLANRLKTGHRLQAIVGAMCVSHAELVCEQIGSIFPELRVDWVGTGDDGKPQEANAKVLSKFCPSDGSDPELDVLVHVGMAGEGLDTVCVSEVIHLNAAGVNNTNNQENGRAARFLDGVTGHINFDGCSGFSQLGYVGDAIMDAMDLKPPGDGGGSDGPGDSDRMDWLDLPELPTIRIYDVECISIDSGDETVKKMAAVLCGRNDLKVREFSLADLKNPESEVWAYAIEGVRMMRAQEAAMMNEKSVIKQWEEALKEALSVVTGNVIRLINNGEVRNDRSLAGDIKKRINSRKKRDLGPVVKDVDVYTQHFRWLKALESEMKRTKEVPQWLG